MVAVGADGHCMLHQPDRCTVHGVLGRERLPSACRHFPRVCLIDPRGVFVTLLHYCPTAAWLLFDDRPVSVMEGSDVGRGHGAPEGLDARETWPPLLTDRVLMDYDSYALWEAHAIDVLAGEGSAGQTPAAALARLRAEAEELSR